MKTIEHTNRPAQRLALWRGLLLMFLGLMVMAGAAPAEAEQTNIRSFYGVESGQTISGEIEIGAKVSGDNDELHFRLVGPKELDWSVKIEVQRQGHRPSFAVDEDGAAIAWDTTQVPNGKYLLTCYAKDEAGEVISTRAIEFRVSNHGKNVKRESNETQPSEEPAAKPEEEAPAEVAAAEEESQPADEPAVALALNSATNPVLKLAFDVQFGDFDNTYSPNSGKALPLKVVGAPAAGTDVLVLAWSDAEQRMVDEFAFVLKSAPWEIPADRLKELPSGNVSLQLLPRVNGKIQSKLKREIKVQEPKMSFRLTFDNPPATYVRGSGKSIVLKANEALPANTVVHYDALRHNGTGRFDSLVRTAMSGDDWTIPASSLDKLPAGRSILRIAVRDADEINVIKHPIQVIIPAPVNEPTPVTDTGTDPVVEPNPSTPLNGAALFVSKPAVYTPGVSGDIAFNVDSLPEGGDVMIIAWSDSKFAMVDAFAHTMKSGPWRISASKLALLPPGEVELQLIVRGGETRHKTVHRINVAGSTTNPSPGDEPADSGNSDSGNNADPVDGGDSSNGGSTDTPGDSAGGSEQDPIDVPQDPTPTPDPDPTPDPVDVPDFETSAEGFTKLTKSADTRVIYVSSSRGNDSNDGLSESKPVKTLARGHDLLRNGKPDWLLLKAGDVWDGESFTEFTKSGAGASKPMVVSVYGQGARPMIMPAAGQHGFKTRNDRVNGLVIKGLHLYAVTRDVASPRYVERLSEATGFNIRIGGSEGKSIRGVVIEDCKITHFDDNILIADDWARTQGEGVPGRIQIVVRRNIIQYAQGDDSHSVGLYIEGSNNSVIEQNFLDHNGWHPANGIKDKNKRSHNIYAQRFNGPITVRHNIISRAGAHGLQLRAGGEILNNLFVRNAMAFYTSVNDSKANYNVILESIDIDPDQGDMWRGMGINGFGMNRYEVIGNVCSTRLGTRQVPGIEVAASQLIVKNNIVYKWRDGNDGNVSITANGAQMSGNIIPENFGWKVPPFVDPDRNLETYAKTLGMTVSTNKFLDTIASRPHGKWVDAYDPAAICRYIRNGFELIPHD